MRFTYVLVWTLCIDACDNMRVQCEGRVVRKKTYILELCFFLSNATPKYYIHSTPVLSFTRNTLVFYFFFDIVLYTH